MSNEQRNIPITDIDKPRISLRPVRRKSIEYIEMVESVRKDGILQPILVRPKEGRYEIVEGWHRYEAAKEAGLEEMPAMVRDMTDRDVLIFQLKCNAIRPETRTFEYARRLKILMEEGMTLDELSVLIGKSQEWIKNQIQLNRLCEEARPAVVEGKIKMGSALALANLPLDLQPKFLDDAIEMGQPEFVDKAKAARRDFQAFLLQEQQYNYDIGATRPNLRVINVLKREALKPTNAKKVLKAVKAKTPLDGWVACLQWAFKLDPISVQDRKAGRKGKEQADRQANNEEYRKMNRDMIKKFVVPQSRNGDYRNVE